MKLATAALLLIILCVEAQANSSPCHEENVEFDGQTHSTTNARTASDCQRQCDNSRCSHWTWKNGRCEIKRIANPGKKIPTRGAVSGGKSSDPCTEKVKGVACHYVDTKQPILCLFPFKTLKLGYNPVNEKISHNTCIKRTTSGHMTCATKLDLTNLVVESSLYNKDVDCGDRTNDLGQLYCSAKGGSPAGSCPELETYKKRVADLERENNELKGKMGSSTSQTASCPAWGKWSSWGLCSRSCLQSRKRTCSKPAEDVEEKKCPTITCSQDSSGGRTSKTSCTGRCGKTAPLGSCQCSSTCFSFGDCCKDYSSVCGAQDPTSCSGKCGNAFDRKLSCQCNVGCDRYNNCCKDYTSTCKASGSGSGRPGTSGTGRPSTSVTGRPSTSGSNKNGVSDAELVNLFEDLLQKDTNNVADLLILNTGCSTRVGNPRDCSNHPLFSSVDSSIFRKPIYKKLKAVYDNYNDDVSVVEDRTRTERQEEDAFLDEVMQSATMKSALDFLKSKKLFNKSNTEFRKLLGELWFALYSRGNRILGSSGFEHVFLGEKKLGKVQGFHNWVFFYHMENLRKVNYLGHWEAKKLGFKGTGLSFTFTWGKEQKPYASMLIGTSPEFELALYTTCLLARGDEKCNVQLGGQRVSITTHVFDRPGGVKYIASSYMDWE